MFSVVPVLGGAGRLLHVRTQSTGHALLIEATYLCDELGLSPALRHQLSAYACVLMTQPATSVVCTRHPIDRHVAGWSLMSGDCAGSGYFRAAHDCFSCMLGVRRPGVTEAAQSLQSRGLIKYRREPVQTLDRADLKVATYVCHHFEKRDPSEDAERRVIIGSTITQRVPGPWIFVLCVFVHRIVRADSE